MTANGDWRQRITVHPTVLVGKPTVRGLRLSVEQILRAKAAGIPDNELLREYPDLQPEDIAACLAYAAVMTSAPRSL